VISGKAFTWPRLFDRADAPCQVGHQGPARLVAATRAVLAAVIVMDDIHRLWTRRHWNRTWIVHSELILLFAFCSKLDCCARQVQIKNKSEHQIVAVPVPVDDAANAA
jgi:hypothetical protein